MLDQRALLTIFIFIHPKKYSTDPRSKPVEANFYTEIDKAYLYRPLGRGHVRLKCEYSFQKTCSNMFNTAGRRGFKSLRPTIQQTTPCRFTFTVRCNLMNNAVTFFWNSPN